jgi:AraC family transcriptional regulator
MYPTRGSPHNKAPDRPDSDHNSEAKLAARLYAQLLSGTGGEEVEAVCRRVPGHDLAVALYTCQPYDLAVPAIGVSRLSINLTASRVTGGVDGERARSYEAQPLSMFMTPAGAPIRWRKAMPSRHISVYYDVRRLVDGLEGMAPWDAGGPSFNVALRGAQPLVELLAAELTDPDPFITESVDCLARLLLVQFARRSTRCGRAQTISVALLRQLDLYVDAHLQQRVLVADMAAAVGLPAGAFAQAYLRHTGHSPYQFVLARRVLRACDLLRHGRKTIAVVAAECGFASQQHMTRVFRRRLGTTPGAVRGVDLHENHGD